MTWLASEEKLPAKTHTARPSPADRGEAKGWLPYGKGRYLLDTDMYCMYSAARR
jgi:hypothetical protein